MTYTMCRNSSEWYLCCRHTLEHDVEIDRAAKMVSTITMVRCVVRYFMYLSAQFIYAYTTTWIYATNEVEYVHAMAEHSRGWGGEIAHEALGLDQHHPGIILVRLPVGQTHGHSAG